MPTCNGLRRTPNPGVALGCGRENLLQRLTGVNQGTNSDAPRGTL